MKKKQFVGLEDTAAGEIHTAARWDSSTKLTSLRPGVAAMFWICYHDELRNLIHSKNCNPLSRLAALAAYNVFIAVIIIKTVNPTNSMSLTWGCGGWRSLGVASAQVSRRPPPRTAWVQSSMLRYIEITATWMRFVLWMPNSILKSIPCVSTSSSFSKESKPAFSNQSLTLWSTEIT